MQTAFAVLGCGSWGTALAQRAACLGHEVSLWDKDTDVLSEIAATARNSRYHEGVDLSSRIRPEADLAGALSGARFVILAVPSHVMREVLTDSRAHLGNETIVINAAKGIETDGCSVFQIVESVLGIEASRERYAVLSGPGFAHEVIREKPAAVTLASRSKACAEAAQKVLHSETFRVFTTDDVTGVEIAGALKNVVAIAVGAADGFGFGLSARASLMTRGLAEIARIGTRKGAHPLTFQGLAGLGDLILTCTGDLSRNRRFGLKIAEGKSLKEALREVGQVVEGIRTAKAAYLMAKSLDVDVPILGETYLALHEHKPPEQAIADILSRGPEAERT